jgi:hypothetical protein
MKAIGTASLVFFQYCEATSRHITVSYVVFFCLIQNTLTPVLGAIGNVVHGLFTT